MDKAFNSKNSTVVKYGSSSSIMMLGCFAEMETEALQKIHGHLYSDISHKLKIWSQLGLPSRKTILSIPPMLQQSSIKTTM